MRLAEGLQTAIAAIGTATDIPEEEPPAELREIDAEIFERLATLQEQLEDFDSGAEDSLDALRADLAGTVAHRLLAPVAKLVSSYDMEPAAAQLAEVIGKLKEHHSE
jgi:hypothetical protein